MSGAEVRDETKGIVDGEQQHIVNDSEVGAARALLLFLKFARRRQLMVLKVDGGLA